MAGEGSRFLKEGKTIPKQMGNDKWQMTNIEDSISNLQSPISNLQLANNCHFRLKSKKNERLFAFCLHMWDFFCNFVR